MLGKEGDAVAQWRGQERGEGLRLRLKCFGTGWCFIQGKTDIRIAGVVTCCLCWAAGDVELIKGVLVAGHVSFLEEKKLVRVAQMTRL